MEAGTHAGGDSNQTKTRSVDQSVLRTITITGYKRPAVFRQLLQSLIANDLTGWRIWIHVEPTEVADQYVAAAADILAGCDYRIEINPERLGVRKNPFSLLEKAFAAGSQVNVYLEEDMVIASDVTRLASWYNDHHQTEWLCLSLLSGGCGGYGYHNVEDRPELLFPSKCFNSMGFIVRRDEWSAHFRGFWMAEDKCACRFNGNQAGGWDWAIYHHLIQTEGLYSLQSVAARATHTGREDGVHCNPAEHDLMFGDLTVTPGLAESSSYKVVPIPSLPQSAKQYALLWEETSMALRAMSEKERSSRRALALARWCGVGAVAIGGLAVATLHRYAENDARNSAMYWLALCSFDLLILIGLFGLMQRQGRKIKWVIPSSSGNLKNK